MNLDRFGFKAKSKRTGQWVYANMEETSSCCYGIRCHYNENEVYADVNADPETLCQCTGIHDSAGRLIYENDIVQVADRQYTVVYHEPSNTREIQGETEDRSFTALQNWIRQGVKCIVIGNKFDKEVKNG